MSERERDSLLDLDIENPPVTNRRSSQRIEVVDHTSPTLPPDQFHQIIPIDAGIIIEPSTIKHPATHQGIPDSKMPVGQEETTQPYDKFDPDEIYSLDLENLFAEKTGEKITRLLG